MLKKITPTLLAVGLLVGCAKEKSYDTKHRVVEELAIKKIKTHKMVQSLDGSSKLEPIKYLYVPMTLGTPREVAEANPFYQGQEKVVRLEWSKSGLEILEIEKDGRFNDNDLNDLPVLTIPGKYKAYECKEDAYGDCTNTEVENTELTWDKKTHFTPDYAGLKVREVNMLDAANIEGDSCVSPQATKVVDYEIADGVINIELEKTYKLRNSWRCIMWNYFDDKFSYNSFKVRFFYSMVELDQLATPGYQKIAYPDADHDEFGYFKNESKTLNDNFDSQRKEKEFLLNRWAPNRKNNELVYYLSANFTKPENKVLLDATYKGVNVINKGLKAANSPFSIKLVEQKMGEKEVSPGDLRYNTLVLIEDPLANGLLGYGPSVTNPYTGEIVQAHVNMYGGVLSSIVRRVYNAASDITIERAKGDAQMIAGVTVAPEALDDLPDGLAKSLATAVSEEDVAAAAADANALVAPLHEVAAVKRIDTRNVTYPGHNHRHSHNHAIHEISMQDMKKRMDYRMKEKVNLRKELAHTMGDDLSDLNELEKRVLKMERREFGKSIDHRHAPEFFPIGGTTKVVYPELFKIAGATNPDGTLKKWDNLNKAQKKAAFDIVLEKSWIATLIHEFGHNLGLRHNFAGSTDVDNFYTLAEAEALGMEGQPAYSSIMDYSYSKFNQLKALGKYDIAALRFAYAREVELADGSIQKVNGSVSDLDVRLEAQGKARKSYSFCTDENAGLSSTCNRFDEGVNLEEVAKFRIKHYEDMYKYRNFRDGRLDYSAYNVGGYARWRYRELGQIRDIMEEYEFFYGIFGEQTMSQGCSEDEVKKYPVCKMINDRIAAVNVIGDFFVKVLKTPDHICALAKADKPNVIVEYRKLAEIYDKIKYDSVSAVKTCFDERVAPELTKDGLVAIGENGKFLNGFKDNNPNYKYVTDRAVLGTWIDRVFAMDALFKRRWRNRSTDTNHMALVDIPSIREKVMGVLGHMITGTTLPDPVPFTMANGAKFQVPYVIGNSYRIEQVEDGLGWLRNFFNLRKGTSNLIEVVLKQIGGQQMGYGAEDQERAYVANNLVAIDKTRGYIGEANRAPNKTYYYNGETTYVSNDDTPLAKVVLTTIIEKPNLDKMDPQLILEVFKRRTAPAAPEELSDAHKLFFMLNEGMHRQLITLSKQGADVPEAAFINAFGPENGPLIFSVYKEGHEIMETIVATKTAIMTTPQTDAEKPLFEYPVELLRNYLLGNITDGLVEYYKGQLKRLPLYQGRVNI